MRIGRDAFSPRKITILPKVNIHAEGSCLISWGNTRIFITATVEEKVPPFLRGQGSGWVTAEYAMVPRATNTRVMREIVKGKQNGRSQEISRLIGRSLRRAVNLKMLGERQIILDCDVLQADGGTRCAAITGAYVALAQAIYGLMDKGLLKVNPLQAQVAALSVGVVDGEPLIDLEYIEDSKADCDMNVVMDSHGGYVELQGTGEGKSFTKEELDLLLEGAKDVFELLFAQQRAVLGRD